MAAFGPDEPRSPRARAFLEYLRGVAALVCLALVAYSVVSDRPLEQLVLLLAAAGLFLGLDLIDKLKGNVR